MNTLDSFLTDCSFVLLLSFVSVHKGILAAGKYSQLASYKPPVCTPGYHTIPGPTPHVKDPTRLPNLQASLAALSTHQSTFSLFFGTFIQFSSAPSLKKSVDAHSQRASLREACKSAKQAVNTTAERHHKAFSVSLLLNSLKARVR